MTLAALAAAPGPWIADGACVGVDPDLFFPTRQSGRDVARAKAVCSECPVTLECLEFALRTHQPGVWGGTSGRERKKMSRHSPANV